MGGERSTYERERKREESSVQVAVGKPERKGPLERPRCR